MTVTQNPVVTGHQVRSQVLNRVLIFLYLKHYRKHSQVKFLRKFSYLIQKNMFLAKNCVKQVRIYKKTGFMALAKS